MTKRGNNTISFRCSRCFCWLGARPSQVGTKQLCPKCQTEVRVPTAEQAAAAVAKADEYHMSDREEASTAERSISMTCPLCKSHLSAPEDQLGQEISCPDCETPVVVVRPKPTSAPSNDPAPGSEYRLQQQWGISGDALDKDYYPIYCHLCRTMVQVSEDMVGQEVECPDCDEPITVPPPPPRRHRDIGRETVAAGQGGSYALQEEADRDRPPPQSELIPIVCPLCETRLYATEAQVGQQINCPDCDESIIVPEPSKRRKQAKSQSGSYEVGRTVAVPKHQQSFPDPRFARPSSILSGEVEYFDDEVLVVPKRWYFTGVFDSPAYPGTYMRWLSLSLGAGLLMFLMVTVLVSATSGGKLAWRAMAIPFASVALVSMTWVVVAGPNFLAIISSTSDGNDEVQDWPSGTLLDWMFEWVYLFLAAVIAFLPGLALFWAFEPDGNIIWLMVPLPFALVFPFVLMSMLEGGLPLYVFSLPVARSLGTHWRAWCIFYLEGTLVMGVAAGLSFELIWMAGAPATLFVAPVLVGAMFIYFRLLGRLAWRCSTGELADNPQPENEMEPGDDEEQA